ncbi:catalase [Negadavirga shengliensis]|uniref:Catalase n=1 Tax=Negadavirga shengliensis TaxID=1389218 RepID=A0ABV9SZE6_9BACT
MIEKSNHREEKEIQEIIKTMKDFLAKTYPDGNIRRNFHPKMHGCVKGMLEVRKDIPAPLRCGLFKKPASYEAWLRFSNAPPIAQSDKRSSGRGLAIKVLDVPGEVLEPDPIGKNSQNFLLTTSPILSAWNISLYRKAIKAVLFGWKERLRFALNPGHWRSLYLTLKYSKKHDNLLAQTYFSGGAFKYGTGKYVKFLLEPHHPELEYTLSEPKSDDFLKAQLKTDLVTSKQGFTLCIQVHDNEKTEPLENTSIVWKKESIPVADLWIPRQEFDFPEREELGDALVFSPWIAMADHEPVGEINRARKRVYQELAELRSS